MSSMSRSSPCTRTRMSSRMLLSNSIRSSADDARIASALMSDDWTSFCRVSREARMDTPSILPSKAVICACRDARSDDSVLCMSSLNRWSAPVASRISSTCFLTSSTTSSSTAPPSAAEEAAAEAALICSRLSILSSTALTAWRIRCSSPLLLCWYCCWPSICCVMAALVSLTNDSYVDLRPSRLFHSRVSSFFCSSADRWVVCRVSCIDGRARRSSSRLCSASLRMAVDSLCEASIRCSSVRSFPWCSPRRRARDASSIRFFISSSPSLSDRLRAACCSSCCSRVMASCCRCSPMSSCCCLSAWMASWVSCSTWLQASKSCLCRSWKLWNCCCTSCSNAWRDSSKCWCCSRKFLSMDAVVSSSWVSNVPTFS
mmetsp:Transcript_30287/g.75218  ORF Transcript_30287/g.75218 Transcript_30287/m.75218 type:complete len:373 (+) Transcript_30287:1577-2695(+)